MPYAGDKAKGRLQEAAMRVTALLLATLFLACATGCSGDSADAPSGRGNASLTEQDIQLFLRVYLKWTNVRESPATHDQTERFLLSQDVDPVKMQWIMERVMLGYMVISLEQELPLLKKRIANVDRTRQKILRNRVLDEEQKENIRREFDELIQEQREILKRMHGFKEEERELLLAHEREVGSVLHQALGEQHGATRPSP
jgi:hypothetical protein